MTYSGIVRWEFRLLPLYYLKNINTIKLGRIIIKINIYFRYRQSLQVAAL